MTSQKRIALFTAEYMRLDAPLKAWVCRMVAKLTALEAFPINPHDGAEKSRSNENGLRRRKAAENKCGFLPSVEG